VRSIPLLAIALCSLGFAGSALAQEPGKGQQAKPAALFATVRDLINDGKYDLAANFIQLFLESNPTDTDLLDLEKKYNTTVFLSLRNIPSWSDDKEVDKKARANVEKIIERAKAASEKLLYDPARVAKYIRNLGATYEEKIYAQLELKRTGDFAIPYMVEELRITREKTMQSALIETIGILEGSTMSGWIAALDGLPPDLQYGVVATMVSRADALNLQSTAQSDLSPYLWRWMSQPADQNPVLHSIAERILTRFNPGVKADSKVPEAELTALARTFYDHAARFANVKNNGDGSPKSTSLWVWDAKNSKLIKLDEVPIGQAEEYYGTRYVRWVLQQKPSYEPAQGLMIALAAEKAIERAKFGNLAKAEPAVFRLLSDAPSKVLVDQLEQGLNQKRTSLVVAMIQVLGDRADRDAATPPAGLARKPSLLVKALSYPDPQVQFAAANALLRSPVPVPEAVRSLIVDILRRAAGASPRVPDSPMGTVLYADPNKTRSDATSLLLRGMGYQVEVVTTGRDLLRRIARSSDFDFILIDYHTPNPELIDLIGQIHADVKAANRPTLVVASPDKARIPTFDQLLVRFAALIASTENTLNMLPPPFVADPRDVDKQEELAKTRRDNADQRDNIYHSTAEARIARLNRVIDTTGISLNEAQKLLLALRIELLTYAILKLQYPFSESSAPGTTGHIERLRRQLNAQQLSPPYGVGSPTMELQKLIDRFELDLARVPPRKKEFETLYVRIDPSEFGLPVETFRDQAIEARLERLLRNYPNVRIIPELYSRSAIASDFKTSYSEPAQAPRDPAEIDAAQKVAVYWLRKMAVGDIPGFDLKPAEEQLRAALSADDLADNAIDAVAKFGSATAQESLITLALNGTRPLPLRIKAADAVIRQIQANGKAISKASITSLIDTAGSEADLILRGKLLILKGILAYNQDEFVNQLKGYDPPILPPLPAKTKTPGKEPAKDQDRDKDKAKDPPPR
jgi:CheY-like chemotaxis protein